MQTVQDLPDAVRKVLDDLLASARAALGDRLRSVILYGSAAEGRLRPTSDVNLLFVLARFDDGIDALREPFRVARAAANVNAMFILEAELPHAAEAFAQKFADIERRHVVLFGDDVHFAIPRAALVRRLRQVLLNLTLRLRDAYVERSLREEQCAQTVAEAAAPLRTSAASILELEGGGALPPKEALAAMAGELGTFAGLLPHLSEAREHRALPAGEGAAILFSTMELARALHERALRLEP